jgi:deoxyadenosine/deoxycytidine kinase
MIIMLTSAFGVGKSSIAEALTQSLPNSMLFDPKKSELWLEE